MPELPEVETIHRQLLGIFLDGHTVSEWEMSVDHYIMFSGFTRTPLVRLQRKGKNFCWYGRDFTVLNHLRMSGRLHVVRSMNSTTADLLGAFKYVKSIFSFYSTINDEASFKIVFTDTRGFGICDVKPLKDPATNDHSRIKLLGPDPTYPNEFTFENFQKSICDFPNQYIASVIVRQDVIAGIGNIYRSEILHQAGIHPCRLAASFTPEEWSSLYEATTKIIQLGIKNGGCSIKDSGTYRDLYGNKGTMQHHLAVYQRDDQKCLSCETGIVVGFNIEKLKRVFYCNECQK